MPDSSRSFTRSGYFSTQKPTRKNVACTFFSLSMLIIFNVSSEPLKPTSYIDEKTSLFLGNNKIEIFSTPGHSKGSLSYYIDGKVFTGDALFYRSIGRTDFYDGDFDELITSIKSKLFTLPDDTKVYPGHGPSTTISDEKKYNQYLR